jgi:hypothetical protein
MILVLATLPVAARHSLLQGVLDFLALLLLTTLPSCLTAT